MKRTPLFLVPLCSLACSSSFASVDASIDANDARVPTPDGGPCASGIEWLDPPESLVRLSLAPYATPAITADADGFLVIATHPDLDAHGYWEDVVRIPPDGEPLYTFGARFAPLLSLGSSVETPRVFASTDPSGRAFVAALVEDTLYWSRGPNFDAADGSIAIERTLGAVAFEDDALLVETHDTRDSYDPPSPRNIASRVARYPSDGSDPEELTELDPTFGEEYWHPALATTAEGPWLAIVGAVDSPPAVQVHGPRGGARADASSCNVLSFDLLAESGEAVVISQDCFEEVVVERRPADGGARDRATLTGRDAYAHASQLAASRDELAVVYRGEDGAAHVAVLDRALAQRATDTVPDSWSSAEMPAGPLGIAAMPDGTFAVLTTEATPPALHGVVSVQRFRSCR
jgi:hypothetical protein